MPGCLHWSRHQRLAFAAMVVAFVIGEAKPNHFQTYPATPGTAAPALTSGIAGDRHGLIWIAADDGVYRFDGKHYVKIPGFPFHSARHIVVDSAQNVWAGGKQGLARYTGASWTVVLQQ